MASHSPVNFKNADLHELRFEEVNLGDTTFDDVNLSGAVFHNVALANAAIRDANLTNLSIRDAKLVGMTIDDVLVTDLMRGLPRSTPGLGSAMLSKKAILGEFFGHIWVGAVMFGGVLIELMLLHVMVTLAAPYFDGGFVLVALKWTENSLFLMDIAFLLIWAIYSLGKAIMEMVK